MTHRLLTDPLRHHNSCFVAAASPSSVRHISWPSGLAMPSSSVLFCSCNHEISR